MQGKGAIAVLSGGMDSAVMLWKLREEGVPLKALTVDYGQRHRREIEAAKALARRAGVEHRVVDLSGLAVLMGGSSQTDPSVPVPHGHYEEASMKKTVVPNRNMLLLAAAAVAYHYGLF